MGHQFDLILWDGFCLELALCLPVWVAMATVSLVRSKKNRIVNMDSKHIVKIAQGSGFIKFYLCNFDSTWNWLIFFLLNPSTELTGSKCQTSTNAKSYEHERCIENYNSLILDSSILNRYRSYCDKVKLTFSWNETNSTKVSTLTWHSVQMESTLDKTVQIK